MRVNATIPFRETLEGHFNFYSNINFYSNMAGWVLGFSFVSYQNIVCSFVNCNQTWVSLLWHSQC